MYFSNAVTDWRGRTVGFRCLQCGSVVQSMWGNYCNRCREDERRHREIVEAIQARSLSINSHSPVPARELLVELDGEGE